MRQQVELEKNIMYKISKIVADRFEVSPEFIFKDTRKHKVTDIRSIFHYMCYKYTGEGIKKIGAFSQTMGRKEPHHHASVVYAVKKVEGFMEVDDKIKEDVHCIETKIQKQISNERYFSKKKAITVSNIINKIFYEEDYDFLISLDSLISGLYEKKDKEELEFLIATLKIYKTQKTTNEGVHKATSDNSGLGVV